MYTAELLATIRDLVRPGTGILAADESTATIKKRFDGIQLESTEETRCAYRDLLFTAPELEKYISGVILYEETLNQKSLSGVPFPELLAQRGIVPGIKVDKGVKPIPASPTESYTQGLDGLSERLREYKQKGARFAKWRAVLNISDVFPSDLAIHTNAEGLAAYAALCQQEGVVPIVEPELLMDGNHTIERCFAATEVVLQAVFAALAKHRVMLEGIILKPSMVISGNTCAKQASVTEVAEATLKILRRTVPAAVPSINFLSGGQSDTVATEHLRAMNASKTPKPWYVSFSYGRALQAPALKAWSGKPENVAAAQKALITVSRANSEATVSK